MHRRRCSSHNCSIRGSGVSSSRGLERLRAYGQVGYGGLNPCSRGQAIASRPRTRALRPWQWALQFEWEDGTARQAGTGSAAREDRIRPPRCKRPAPWFGACISQCSETVADLVDDTAGGVLFLDVGGDVLASDLVNDRVELVERQDGRSGRVYEPGQRANDLDRLGVAFGISAPCRGFRRCRAPEARNCPCSRFPKSSEFRQTRARMVS